MGLREITRCPGLRDERQFIVWLETILREHRLQLLGLTNKAEIYLSDTQNWRIVVTTENNLEVQELVGATWTKRAGWTGT